MSELETTNEQERSRRRMPGVTRTRATGVLVAVVLAAGLPVAACEYNDNQAGLVGNPVPAPGATSTTAASTTTPPAVTTTTPPPPPPTTTPPPAKPSTARPAGALAPNTVPQPGQVGFRGDPGSLTVISGPGNVPRGTRWDTAGALVVDGDLTLENVFIKGGLLYQGGGTLTVRNSIIESYAPNWSVIMADGGHIDVRDTTLRWRDDSVPGRTWGNGAIHGDATMTVIRCDISGTPDGVQNGPGNSLFEQNYIHDLRFLGKVPNETHNDGIQNYGGRDLVIRYNRIDLVVDGLAYDGHHQNGAVFVQPSGGFPSVNLQVIGNYLAGGGFTLRLEEPMRSAVVTGNRFGPTTGGWGEVTREGDVQIAQWSDNLNVNGRPIPKP